MNVSIYYKIVLVLGFLIMLVLVLVPVKVGFSMVEWEFVVVKLSLNFNVMMFAFILLMVSLSVLVYSNFYMEGEVNLSYYLSVLVIFVVSMVMLSLSNNSFSMLVSWDLLGISSFFLVMFYNNWDSCSGAMNTVLTNRVGDYLMFVFFSSMVYVSYYFGNLMMVGVLSGLTLIVCGSTKSAQFPFSSWLPKAMSAPTPVSSLVHSSTLVTAGLILMMNFEGMLLSKQCMELLVLLGLVTMTFSSMLALVEEDFKKVVALSTLSQLGFCVMTLGMGYSFLVLVHLVSHAVFKSCLFMQIGYVMHSMKSQQDGRFYTGVVNVPLLVQMQLLVTLFCLCGLIFSSGAVSKDFILLNYFGVSVKLVLGVLFFGGVLLTFGYSLRLWKMLFKLFGDSVGANWGSSMVNLLSLVLFSMSLFFMWWMSENFFVVPEVFLYFDFYVMLMLLVVMMGVMLFSYKVVLSEFSTGFVMNMFNKSVSFWLVNVKFGEMVLWKWGLISAGLVGMVSKVVLMMLRSKSFSVVALVVGVLLMVVI